MALCVAAGLIVPSPAGIVAPQMAVSPQAVSPPANGVAERPSLAARDAATVLARPLFTEGRRPPAAVPASAEIVSADRLPRLSGVLVAGTRRQVILVVADRSVVGGVGSTVGGYVILAIAPTSVTLRGPSGLRTLRLGFDPKQPAPEPPGPPTILDLLNSGQRPAPGMPKPVTVQDLMATLPKPPG